MHSGAFTPIKQKISKNGNFFLTFISIILLRRNSNVMLSNRGSIRKRKSVQWPPTNMSEPLIAFSLFKINDAEIQ